MSWQVFLNWVHMDGHGFYIWLAYGIFVALLLLQWVSLHRQKMQLKAFYNMQMPHDSEHEKAPKQAQVMKTASIAQVKSSEAQHASGS